MSSQWLCIFDENGIPIFSRSYGLPPPAFSLTTTGPFSVIQSQALDCKFDIKRLSSKDCNIVYRTYQDLIIVLATSNIEMDQSLIEKKLDHVYDALVFVLGTRKLHVAKNRLVARRQRETAIWSAQSFLSLFILEDSHLVEMACGLPEIMLPSNKRMFKHVETLAQVCNTPNAAFYANNRLYAGTKNWRNLDSRDLFTISTYLRSLPEAKYRDIPVFLSHSNLDSNNNNDSSSNRNDNSSNSRKEKTSGGLIPYRLLTLRLTKHLMLVMLCGPAPSLSHAIELVGNIVRTRTGMKEDLQAAVDSDLHRHIPRSIQVDSGVLGMLVALHPGERGTGQGGISRKRLLTCFNPLSMLDNPHRTTIHNTTRHHQTGATDNNINTHNPHNHPNQNKIRSSAINYRARLLTCFYSTVAPELEQVHVLQDANSTDHSIVSRATDAMMKVRDRCLYARAGAGSTIFVLFSENVPTSSFQGLTRELQGQIEQYVSRL